MRTIKMKEEYFKHIKELQNDLNFQRKLINAHDN
jgi:hypothetical protein